VSEPTDEQLFAAHVAGDPDAFFVLVDRYTPRLRALMRRRASRAADVDELVQETFLHLHRSAADFEQGRPLRPWLMTIALNTRRAWVRRRARKPESPLDLDGRNDPVAPDPRLDARRDAQRQVARALEGLSDGQREVIELHWLGGLSMAEVARAVGASVSAVKVRAHRGYARMRELLGEGA
jgi:RNA polymerase sigma-70 factor (ECF subfamily)